MGKEAKPIFDRRLREETVHINGAPVKFYRCRRKRRWMWRVMGGKIQLPPKER